MNVGMAGKNKSKKIRYNLFLNSNTKIPHNFCPDRLFGKRPDHPVHHLPVGEEEKAGDRSDPKLHRQPLVVIGVALCKCDFAGKLLCKFFNYGCNTAAWPAPFRPEIDHKCRMLLQYLGKMDFINGHDGNMPGWGCRFLCGIKPVPELLHFFLPYLCKFIISHDPLFTKPG